MQTAVTSTGQNTFSDSADIGPSQINVAIDQCRDNRRNMSFTHDCTSHWLIFRPVDNSVCPLLVEIDTWCTSAQFLLDGVMIQVGRYNNGVWWICSITQCGYDGYCDRVESADDMLQAGRSYAFNHMLPYEIVFVLGGQCSPTYEVTPRNGVGLFTLPLLETKNYFDWYPLLHLLLDNTLYILADEDLLILDCSTDVVIKKFLTTPGVLRNYPCARSSAMLALENGGKSLPEVMVCGRIYHSTGNITAQHSASQTCGRVSVCWTKVIFHN